MIRSVGKFLGRSALAVIALGGAFWVFGPYEEVNLSPTFEPRKFGEGVQVYFESTESGFKDITSGVAKRVIWQDGFKEQRSPYSVVYLHGFSATSEEIRPVPDRVAAALGANLVFTRLRGHGRGSDPMIEATASDWMQDAAEALAAGRAVGEQVVVIATSTGATLAAAAALNPEMSKDVAAAVFVSPNFGLNDPFAWILTLPAARHWAPLLMGGERVTSGENPEKDKYWTTRYSWGALAPLAALVQDVEELDFSQVTVPALFRLSDEDRVVRPDLGHEVAGRWGATALVQVVKMGPQDDPAAHVITGDIMSPGQTDETVRNILNWLETLGIK